MSRATSGSDIFFDKSAMRFSSSAISASMISGLRGFLMILTRVAAAHACGSDLRLDPPADLDGTDLRCTREDCALPDGRASDTADAGRTDPPATAGGSDLPAFQS